MSQPPNNISIGSAVFAQLTQRCAVYRYQKNTAVFLNASNMTTMPRDRKTESLHTISLKHSYGKENRREHCRPFARLDFCRNCLQLMTSRKTAVYRYHGTFQTVYYRRAFPNTAHPEAHPCAQRTRTHRDHATCDICSNRPHLTHCVQTMRPTDN